MERERSSNGHSSYSRRNIGYGRDDRDDRYRGDRDNRRYEERGEGRFRERDQPRYPDRVDDRSYRPSDRPERPRGYEGYSRGRGDFGGDRGPGGGRFGGQGQGRGDFGGRGRGGGGGVPAQCLIPIRDTEEGSAATPAKTVKLISAEDSEEKLKQEQQNYDARIKAVIKLPRPCTKGGGTNGDIIQVQVNHFKVVCKLDKVCQFDVQIDEKKRPDRPEAPSKPLPPELLRAAVKALAEQQRWPPGWAYDGRKILFTTPEVYSRCLHQERFEVKAADPESGRRPRDLQIVIKWTADIDMTELYKFVRGGSQIEIPQIGIQALDVVLKSHALMSTSHLVVGRGLIFNQEQVQKSRLGNGAEAWKGYSQSLRFGQGCLTLNIDLACTAFLEEVPVLQFLLKAAGVSRVEDLTGMTPKQQRLVNKAITGLKVEVTHMGNKKRRYKVKSLLAEGASELTFQDENNVLTTVAAYFERQYSLRLAHPSAPCLNVGSPNRRIYLPIEVCKIAKGQRRLKLDSMQTAEMIKTAAQRPRDRFRFIQGVVRNQADFGRDATVQAFGLEVEPRMMQVEARRLEAPRLQYKVELPAPLEGKWNIMQTKFHTGASLRSYGVTSFVDRRRAGREGDRGSLMAFMHDLMRKLHAVGLKMPREEPSERLIAWHDGRDFPGETIDKAAAMAKSHFGEAARIIFVLLPDQKSLYYPEVKRATDSFLGIPSQCFAANKANVGFKEPGTKGRDQYLSNLAMKINVKLDGVNCAVEKLFEWQKQPYMVFGADVTHHATGDRDKPSIASVCGSIDTTCTRFASCSRLLGVKVEMIMDLRRMAMELLTAFKDLNRRLPERIIFYRDGVSEGQFSQVLELEIPQLMQACLDVGGNMYNPPVTFIVVQKRHNTKIVPVNEKDGDKNGNCQPGTVVDKGIVHPTAFSFFLNSHAGLQGTNRSAHYTVLLDQINFTEDQLQAFTYNMTYTFARCTRSVGVCPPAYYAHLAAERGRHLLVTGESEADSDAGAMVEQAKFADVHQNLRTRMFYI